tara:strand:+ start:53 stop:1348 length:1296 start_codon:yes stop_codon:yes gene_type:complete
MADILIVAALFMATFTSAIFLLVFLENMNKMGNPKILKYPTVSIIIAAHNEESCIADTIENALAIEYPKNKIEIIVIENGGSTDRTLEIAKKYRNRGVRVFSIKGGGKGHALNYIIKNKIKSEIVVTMDADSFANPDILKRMLGYFRDPKIMAVAPTILTKGRQNFVQKIQHIEYMLGAFLRKVFHFMDAIYVTPGAFTAYRKSFFDKYGLYDEKNITEDFEMALRIQSKRLKMANAVDALVFTIAPKTFSVLLKQRIRWFLGFIDTTIQYKGLFKASHGYLGAIILPTALLAIVYTIYLFFVGTSKLFSFFYKDILLNVVSGEADLVSWFYSMKFSPFYFGISTVGFVSVVIISLGFLMFLLARKYSGDRTSYTLAYMIYFFLYIFFFSAWWLSAFWVKVFGRELKFGGVVWRNSVVNKYIFKSSYGEKI